MSLKKRTKFEMVLTVSVALLAVVSVGVSTFAWFQANANVNIETTSDSTTITVNKPEDYFFYAYKGNVAYDYNDDGDIDTADFNGATGTFLNDFALVTGDNVDDLASFDDIYPGKAYTFAVRVDQQENVALKIARIKANDSVREGLEQNRYVAKTSSGTPINVGWAINIYAQMYSPNHGSAPTYNTNVLTAPQTNMGGGTDLFQYDELNDEQVNEQYIHHRSVILAGSEHATTKVVTLTNKIPLLESDSDLSSNDCYMFYSVYFSNANTTYFQEVSAATEASNTPTDIDIIPVSGSRYFRKVTTGNSNCYAGLSFALNELSLELS